MFGLECLSLSKSSNLSGYRGVEEEDDQFSSRLSAEFKLQVAPTLNPRSYIQTQKHSHESLFRFNKGTTTLAFRFCKGVIVAVDSRASQGSFIASQTVRKVIEINDYLLGTMAGGAADCSFWERHLAKLCRLYELQHGERLSVAGVSQILANILHNYKGYGLSCGVMIAGYDKQKGAADLYMVDDSGMRFRGDLFSVGSGSTYAYGVLDSEYKYDLTVEEGVELGRKAIYHATHRDAGSGGVVRVYWVHEGGWTRVIEEEDVNKIHYEVQAAKGIPGYVM